MAIVWKKLAYASDVVNNSLLSGKGDILYASGAGVPARLAIGSNNDILHVATDVPAWVAPGAPGAHTLDSHTSAAGTVLFDLNQASKLVVFTVANEAALPGSGVAVGELCWATGELTLHVCSSAV